MAEKIRKKNEAPSEHYTIADLNELQSIMISQYGPEFRRMRLLDAIDKTDLWSALGAKFPSYQVKPDTNFVSYVKENILASLYTVIKSADITPTSEGDKQIVTDINLALSAIWDSAQVGEFQHKAGERAALVNLGLTQVGWSENLMGVQNALFKKNVALKNLDPMKFMRDPFAESLDTSHYCCYTDTFHKSVFRRNKLYTDVIDAAFNKVAQGPVASMPLASGNKPSGSAKDYYELCIYWIWRDKRLHEVHVLGGAEIIHYEDDLQPSIFPIADLYCNMPAPGMLVGISPPAKILANDIAYNILDSISLTAEYKNQRPPKFINGQSGLNVQAFAKHGDEADRTFIVNGFPDKAVYYHQFPTASPGIPFMRKDLMMNMETVSGVDGRYTGRDTGSIITTGGTEEMLNRVTIIDTPKIRNYEAYSKRLTHLILANLIKFSPDRVYMKKDIKTNKFISVKVPFSAIADDTVFAYAINISSELPRTKQRLMNAANMIMEKQMQYQQEGSAVQLITEEEWLMFQDIPMKEFMLERMGLQRLQDAQEEVSQVLFQYTELISKGMSPDEAIMAVADSLKAKRAGEMGNPGSLIAPPGGDMSGMGMQPGLATPPAGTMPGMPQQNGMPGMPIG